MQIDIYMRNRKLIIIAKHQDDAVGDRAFNTRKRLGNQFQMFLLHCPLSRSIKRDRQK